MFCLKTEDFILPPGSKNLQFLHNEHFHTGNFLFEIVTNIKNNSFYKMFTMNNLLLIQLCGEVPPLSTPANRGDRILSTLGNFRKSMFVTPTLQTAVNNTGSFETTNAALPNIFAISCA
jgi:hypothetical protein